MLANLLIENSHLAERLNWHPGHLFDKWLRGISLKKSYELDRKTLGFEPRTFSAGTSTTLSNRPVRLFCPSFCSGSSIKTLLQSQDRLQ